MRSSSFRSLVVIAPALVVAASCGKNIDRDRATTAPSVSSGIAVGSARAPVPPPAPRLSGAEEYAKYCALCHGKDAKGYAADHAPSLVTETFLASASDEFLSRSIAEGRPGTAMAGYARERGGPLDAQQISTIIRFLRENGPRPLTLPATSSNGLGSRGEETYTQTCQKCHGTPELRGEAPHLANPVFLAAASDAFLKYAILNGRPGTAMKAYAGELPAETVDDVVALLRSWTPAGPAAPPMRPPPPPDTPLEGPIVINPGGAAGSYTMREDRYVAIEQVKKALERKQKMVIIDARATSDWAMAHIPGSVSVPYYALSRLDQLPKDDTWIFAYCACPHHASGVIVDELRKRGFAHTAVLDEGILEWQKRKYPILPPPAPTPAVSSSAPAKAR